MHDVVFHIAQPKWWTKTPKRSMKVEHDALKDDPDFIIFYSPT